MSFMFCFWVAFAGIVFGMLLCTALFSRIVRKSKALQKSIRSLGNEGEVLLYGVLSLDRHNNKTYSRPTYNNNQLFSERTTCSKQLR